MTTLPSGADPALDALLAWPWRWGDAPGLTITDDLIDQGLIKREELGIDFSYRLTAAGLARFSDRDLLAAYQRTDGAPGNQEADALVAEIERRELDI
jgi:hypothetical protein